MEQLVEKWLQLDRDPETIGIIKDLLAKNDHSQLHRLLQPAMQFGTAGLRAEMNAGFACMNSLTVIQASQGVASYLLQVHSSSLEAARARGVVIGFDHRHRSRKFARQSAAVFLHHGFRVHFYPGFVHTPLVPFAVKKLGAVAGVMITASHNPRQDNGYKLYWENACQIIGPHDKLIQAAIERNQVPVVWDECMVDTHARVSDPTRVMTDSYFAEVSRLSSYSYSGADFPVVYTAMHGVGYSAAKRVMACFNLPAMVPVVEQVEPDPDFSTVAYPNPEEGKGALKLAFATADACGSRFIVANDPDADRLALAEKCPKTRDWRVFSGNEIGAMLACYIWCHAKWMDRSRGARDFSMIATTVSSKFLAKMAQVEGFAFEEVLTGFKWIGNRALKYKKDGTTCLFAFEEAIGFMVADVVPDKDGISALAIAAEMAYFLNDQGMTLADYLDSLYEKYGYFTCRNIYYISHDSSKTKAMFDRIRFGAGSATKALNYPKSLGNFNVTAVRDLTQGYDSSTTDNVPALPLSKSSQMITFNVTYTPQPDKTAVFTLRTSGTEPKIKMYSEITGSWKDRQSINSILDELVESVSKELYRAEEYGFKAQKK